MDLQDVSLKWKRRNQILFSRESPCLQELLAQICLQTHRTLVIWAFACVEKPLRRLQERYPQETRPERAVALCREWAQGKCKMPQAKQALLAVHAMAKELSDPVDIALCHAIGQACATVHVETHAIGLALYELTAIVRSCGIAGCEPAVAARIAEYLACLQECRDSSGWAEWAPFLLDDSRPNKEALRIKRMAAGQKVR